MVTQTRRKNYNPPINQIQKKSETSQIKVKGQKDKKIDDQPSVKNTTWKELLDDLYHNTEFAGSYSSKLSEFIRTNDTTSKFKPILKRKFPRRKVVARFPFELFMADLFEYPFYKRINRGFKFGLVIIDCFTRKIFFKSLKNKNGSTVAEALDSILGDLDEPPVNLITDAGTEFFNSNVNKVLDAYGIVHYKTPTKTRWKASFAERAIRTLKTRLAKIFYRRQNYVWYDVIDKVVKNYNETKHSAHGFRPVDVTEANRDEVYKKLYPKRSLSVVCKLFIGDRVRKLREKSQFEKGYTQNWSDEIFIISSVQSNERLCWYYLETLNGVKVPGIWYYYQLNLVSRDATSP